MILDPTDEMLDAHQAAWRAYWTAQGHTAEGMTVYEHGRAAHRECLVAVFAIVERVYEVSRRDSTCQ